MQLVRLQRGELRTIHLGCATASMDGESRRGNLFVGDSLNAAVKLLDESEKGEILVEGMEPVRENALPPELEHMANLNWFRRLDLGEADEHGDMPGVVPGDADSAMGDSSAGFEPDSNRGHGNLRSMRLMRKPSVMARAAQAKAVEEDRNVQVTSTWKLVEANLEANGVAFFRNVFRIAPGALQLFSFRDVPNLYESKELKTHAVKVMSTVGVAVAGLNEVAKLIPVLVMLGKKHLTYGVLPAHYDVVGQALLETLEMGLGEHWTPAAKHAWGAVYGTVGAVQVEFSLSHSLRVSTLEPIK
jgi:hemoglobin-like flavoprotein